MSGIILPAPAPVPASEQWELAVLPATDEPRIRALLLSGWEPFGLCTVTPQGDATGRVLVPLLSLRRRPHALITAVSLPPKL